MNCPHGYLGAVHCPTCGFSRDYKTERKMCPHGHPLNCKPTCGACVRGEPGDKEYVGYAELDAKHGLVHMLAMCNHTTHIAQTRAAPTMRWCPDCGAIKTTHGQWVLSEFAKNAKALDP